MVFSYRFLYILVHEAVLRCSERGVASGRVPGSGSSASRSAKIDENRPKKGPRGAQDGSKLAPLASFGGLFLLKKVVFAEGI